MNISCSRSLYWYQGICPCDLAHMWNLPLMWAVFLILRFWFLLPCTSMSICSSFLSIINSVFGVLCHGLSIKSVEGGQSANIIQDLIFPQLLPPLAFWLNMRDNELNFFPFQLQIVSFPNFWEELPKFFFLG